MKTITKRQLADIVNKEGLKEEVEFNADVSMQSGLELEGLFFKYKGRVSLRPVKGPLHTNEDVSDLPTGGDSLNCYAVSCGEASFIFCLRDKLKADVYNPQREYRKILGDEAIERLDDLSIKMPLSMGPAASVYFNKIEDIKY